MPVLESAGPYEEGLEGIWECVTVKSPLKPTQEFEKAIQYNTIQDEAIYVVQGTNRMLCSKCLQHGSGWSPTRQRIFFILNTVCEIVVFGRSKIWTYIILCI